ncbi:substrate-binding domain-containing protein [Solirubrobacter ginsenosidimutans]|uniref:Substrate-binding domain-containing protein n=1 Tax=Solirubrobacter ginsenosidimutans TaxID=490573 RepID=A0A9X3S319_9ACTN|nr:substrate-binding domain-containing protein [Solirubrobacter ginsenosidimutans]MDA0165210.1 substrate-binding domain-containing protein [Solirubrobacter ginsenosidimutans]
MIRAVALLVAIATLAGAPPARGQTTLTMSGDPVVQALVADLAYFYRHSVPNPPQFALSGGNTTTGIADTERGISDAGLVSRNTLADDPADIVLTPLALSGVCLISSRGNPVPSLTRAQLQDLVAARITNWSQVPGSPRSDAIVPVGRTLATGAGQVFRSVFVDVGTPFAWNQVTLLTSAQVRDYVEQTPGAIGYVDLALTKPVHVINYENVGCTRATIKDGSYPARRPLGLATRGQPHGALARFLRWATTSKKARQVIASRYIPTR